MAQLIRRGALEADDWTRLAADVDVHAALPPGSLLVPLALWQARKTDLLQRDEPVGIWLDSHEHPSAILDALEHVVLVAINFPVFSDGRGYSSARLLRDKYGYTGEMRAIGDVLRDQLFLMWRCGFDSFRIRDDRDAADALASLRDFAHAYQGATVDPGPPLLLRPAVTGS